MGIFSEEFKFHSILQFIPRFGLNSRCFDLISERNKWLEFMLFSLSQSNTGCSIGFTVFMRLISPFGLTAASLWILDKTGLIDQCCFYLSYLLF